MDARTDPVGTTLATWLLLLHRDGQSFTDRDVDAACRAAEAGGDVPSLARALIGAVRTRVRGDGYDDVVAGLTGILPVRTGEAGESSEAARARIHRGRFGDARPWLARVADRLDGTLLERWVIVSDVTDVVATLDPNPWDDVAEDRSFPLDEFVVRWQLAGCRSIAAG